MQNIKCQHCSYSWPNNLVKVSNSSNITFNNVNTNCPRCGRMTRIIEDGTYDFDQNGNVLRRLRQLPKGDLDKIRLAAVAVQNSGGGTQAFQAAISNINASYADIFQDTLALLKDETFQLWMKWLLRLIMTLTAGQVLGDINLNINVNDNDTNVTNNINYSLPASTPDTSYSKTFERDLREKNLKAIKLNKAKIDSAKATKKR